MRLKFCVRNISAEVRPVLSWFAEIEVIPFSKFSSSDYRYMLPLKHLFILLANNQANCLSEPFNGLLR